MLSDREKIKAINEEKEKWNKSISYFATIENMRYAVTSLGFAVAYGYVGRCPNIALRNILIRPEIDGRPVDRINDYCFTCAEDIISIFIPESIKIIYDFAFLNCTRLIHIGNSSYLCNNTDCSQSIKNGEVFLPKSIKILFVSAFSGCVSIDTLRIGKETTVWYHLADKDTIKILEY